MSRRTRSGVGETGTQQRADLVDVSRVRAVLTLGGVPWDALDDGVQQVRLKLMEDQANPNAAEIFSPAAGVSVVASRVAVDWHRAKTREGGLRDRLATRWSRTPPADQSNDVDLALAVAEELDALAPTQRQVLVLRYYEDLAVKDIAWILNVPEGTVKSRLHGAAAAMRHRLHTAEVI